MIIIIFFQIIDSIAYTSWNFLLEMTTTFSLAIQVDILGEILVA